MRIGRGLLRWLTILSAFAAAPVCDASDEENATLSKGLARERDQITRIELKDGQTLLGWVVEQNAEKVILELPVGGRMTIDRQLIGSLRPEAKTRITVTGEIWMRDPIPDRYLLMPSGILLKQGDFYFTQAQLSVSTLTLGVTDFLTIVGGAVVPAWFVRDGFNFIGGVKTPPGWGRRGVRDTGNQLDLRIALWNRDGGDSERECLAGHGRTVLDGEEMCAARGWWMRQQSLLERFGDHRQR
jgi:hypothetical protein